MSFVAQPGQTVALLGATGSGKSSIISLIPRFYDPTGGVIAIDGHDLRDVTIDSLRKQIGIVLQETNLFTGTIRDNIAFGRPEATDEEVIAAAKAAAAHDFIMEFPQGYGAPVGERGATLSGGQKQRIAIARALVSSPRIILADEPTGALDSTTSMEVMELLKEINKSGITIMIVTHEHDIAHSTDRIIHLKDGLIERNEFNGKNKHHYIEQIN